MRIQQKTSVKRERNKLNFRIDLCRRLGVDPLLNINTLPYTSIKDCNFLCNQAFYFFCRGGKVLYLGKTTGLKFRVKEHLRSKRKIYLDHPDVLIYWLEIKSDELMRYAEEIEIYFMHRFYPLLNIDYNVCKPCPLMSSYFANELIPK